MSINRSSLLRSPGESRTGFDFKPIRFNPYCLWAMDVNSNGSKGYGWKWIQKFKGDWSGLDWRENPHLAPPTGLDWGVKTQDRFLKPIHLCCSGQLVGHSKENKMVWVQRFKGSKGSKGKSTLEHLWKVETAEVSRNFRTRPRPHIPTVIVDRLRLWINLLSTRMCSLSFTKENMKRKKKSWRLQ